MGDSKEQMENIEIAGAEKQVGQSERVEGRWNKQRRESEGEMGEQACNVSEATDLI